jgi:hypothetical protein
MIDTTTAAGTPVTVRPIGGGWDDAKPEVTDSLPYDADGLMVVQLAGKCGGYALERVELRQPAPDGVGGAD